MTTRKFVFNSNGKIKFTWEELKSLLDEVYNEGKSEGLIYFWNPPSTNPSCPIFPETTWITSIDSDSIKLNTASNQNHSTLTCEKKA